jgi:hypothetical protein
MKNWLLALIVALAPMVSLANEIDLTKSNNGTTWNKKVQQLYVDQVVVRVFFTQAPHDIDHIIIAVNWDSRVIPMPSQVQRSWTEQFNFYPASNPEQSFDICVMLFDDEENELDSFYFTHHYHGQQYEFLRWHQLPPDAQ